MNKKEVIKVAPKTELEASDLQKQIQQLADAHGLTQRFFNIQLERQPQNNDSVELKKSTKGTSWTIKCYGTSNEAVERANKIFDLCQELYGEKIDESI
jgi:hypothetical protein